jgi:hypothetical protein
LVRQEDAISGSGLDEDTIVIIVTTALALVLLVLSVRAFAGGGIGRAVAWLAAAAVPGFVAYFFATFTMRMM